jgi:hypothetical protein
MTDSSVVECAPRKCKCNTCNAYPCALFAPRLAARHSTPAALSTLRALSCFDLQTSLARCRCDLLPVQPPLLHRRTYVRAPSCSRRARPVLRSTRLPAATCFGSEQWSNPLSTPPVTLCEPIFPSPGTAVAGCCFAASCTHWDP